MYRLPRALQLRQQHFLPPRLSRITQRRPASQIVYKPNGEPVRYQAVRFKKPGLTTRRLATIGLYTGVVYAYFHLVWRYLDVEVEIMEGVDEEDAPAGASAEESEEDEEEDGPYYAEDDSLFIPLTWATKMPRTFYKGSDPEWQEFIKIAKDKGRHKKIQEELVQIVYSGSLQYPIVGRQLGKDTKVGKYWLDIKFPDGPPQEFERSGIEIGDGFIAWSQQIISPENQWRVSRALWPKPVFDSLWATGKVLAGIQSRRVKQAFGWETTDPSSLEEQYKHAKEMVEKQKQARGRKGIGKAQIEPDDRSGALVSASSAADTPPTAASTDASKRFPWQIPVPLPTNARGMSGSDVPIDIPIAVGVFSRTIKKGWNQKQLEPPRGTFVVHGLVEIRGTRGRMLFDVQSCYDPKLGKFVVINAGLRNFKKWNQAPRGGS